METLEKQLNILKENIKENEEKIEEKIIIQKNQKQK